MSNNIVTVTEDNFDDVIINDSKNNADDLYILKLWMETCGPCKMLAPIYGRLADKYVGENQLVKFFDANLDDAPTIASAYGIQSVPTLVFIKNGEQVDTMIGLKNETQINDKITSLIGK